MKGNSSPLKEENLREKLGLPSEQRWKISYQQWADRLDLINIEEKPRWRGVIFPPPKIVSCGSLTASNKWASQRKQLRLFRSFKKSYMKIFTIHENWWNIFSSNLVKNTLLTGKQYTVIYFGCILLLIALLNFYYEAYTASHWFANHLLKGQF